MGKDSSLHFFHRKTGAEKHRLYSQESCVSEILVLLLIRGGTLSILLNLHTFNFPCMLETIPLLRIVVGMK